MIIQYNLEWIVATPCPKRASVRLSHPSLEGRFLPQPGGTAKHLGRYEEGDNCRPLSPGRGMRSGREKYIFIPRAMVIFPAYEKYTKYGTM
ncbi:hypothetical protein [Aneurinibacillus aneurinilyticus]|uniref:hypothetical protein n=1 Tax=Aneurinibacillus aneurinilyticus TaxID=1391 RepID=UPI0011DCE15D|nr:hypothetical protein [Aneurinibacillus aneurinilyticus]MED0709496.1 hypothetical protein [Aneurinibacillus aneurinilyticus]MED0726358.1 hypothetical protein [Aneurinibacillus aneurinilyticus]MED0731611.1 hypothetical protein [Aneurinibacillus aneurinilyticus]